MKVDALARQKNSKRHFLEHISKSFQKVTPMDPEPHHFFQDIENSFHQVTHIGPEPHQFFSFSNISTNTVARGIQSFG